MEIVTFSGKLVIKLTRAKQSERLQDRPMLISYLPILPKSNRKSIGDTFTNIPKVSPILSVAIPIYCHINNPAYGVINAM